MFNVVTRGFSEEFELWTAALETAKGLIPQCKWFQEIRILDKGELVWVYSRSHKYPQFVGPGTYDRLAKRFLLETAAAEGKIDGPDAEES